MRRHLKFPKVTLALSENFERCLSNYEKQGNNRFNLDFKFSLDEIVVNKLEDPI